MTVNLSDYQEGLLREIEHFADTRIADQVRAEFVARNNAEARLEAVKAAVTAAVSNLDEWAPEWSALVPLVRRDLSAALAALSVAPQPEPTVEIGGQVMTQAQFDAARFPLLNADPGLVSPPDEASWSPQPEPAAEPRPDLRGHGSHCYPWDWQYGDNEPECRHRQPEPDEPHNYFEDWTGRERRCPGR